jgi:hypothetical protein
MAENVLQTTNDDQIGSRIAPSIALQESDNPQKERIDLTGNKGINHDILNSDVVINDGVDVREHALITASLILVLLQGINHVISVAYFSCLDQNNTLIKRFLLHPFDRLSTIVITSIGEA